MPEPMSDERLAEIRRDANEREAINWQSDPDVILHELERSAMDIDELLAEVERLKYRDKCWLRTLETTNERSNRLRCEVERLRGELLKMRDAMATEMERRTKVAQEFAAFVDAEQGTRESGKRVLGLMRKVDQLQVECSELRVSAMQEQEKARAIEAENAKLDKENERLHRQWMNTLQSNRDLPESTID